MLSSRPVNDGRDSNFFFIWTVDGEVDHFIGQESPTQTPVPSSGSAALFAPGTTSDSFSVGFGEAPLVSAAPPSATPVSDAPYYTSQTASFQQTTTAVSQAMADSSMFQPMSQTWNEGNVYSLPT